MSKTLKVLGIIGLVVGTATVVGVAVAKHVKKSLDEIEEELYMHAENFDSESSEFVEETSE